MCVFHRGPQQVLLICSPHSRHYATTWPMTSSGIEHKRLYQTWEHNSLIPHLFQLSLLQWLLHTEMDRTSLTWTSTRRTYKSSLHKFCELYSILTPFLVSEAILCYYVSYLLSHNLSPHTIKTDLAGIRYMQVTLGLPEPKEYSSLPRLGL